MYNPKNPDKIYKVYQIRSDVDLESFADGALVLRLTDRRIFELNFTARAILKYTDGQRSVQEVALALAKEYEIGLEEVVLDIKTFYDSFTVQKIVEEVR